jgi:hypothetical protein
MNQDRELELLRKIEALVVDRERLRAALAEMLVEFVAAHKAGHITTMPQTVQRIVRQAEAALATEQKGSTDG